MSQQPALGYGSAQTRTDASGTTQYYDPVTGKWETTLAYGLPTTTQGATFLQEEYAAAAARGEKASDLFAGFQMAPQYAGDFWSVYTLAEQFAANTGWNYLPTPQQITQLVGMGASHMDEAQVFQMMASMTGVDLKAQPWAATGLSATQYHQQLGNLQDQVYALTGTNDIAGAGLGDITNTALTQGWSQQRIADYILQHQDLADRFGWVKAGYTFQQYANWRGQNAQTLRERYGNSYSDQQAVSELLQPLTATHASGGAFGMQQPFVAAQQAPQLGQQTAVR